MKQLLLGPALGTILASYSSIAAAQEAPAPPTDASQADAAPVDTGDIIVTATRRAESTLRVPYNISAVGADTLARSGITDINQIRALVPGLAGPDYGQRGNSINNSFIIRGVNTSSLNSLSSSFPNLGGSAVSSYIDETPLFVNLKLIDVNRVEVLRGPQGTLFGAGSVGGTIRTIHNRPDFKSFDYNAEGGVSGTQNAHEPNYNFNATVNVPFGETLALRVSGSYERAAGFIDATQAVVYTPGAGANSPQPVLADPANPVTSGFTTRSLRDVNAGKSWSVRAALRWRPIDPIDLELAYQHQRDDSNGFNYEYPGSDYQLLRHVGVEPSTTETDLYSATAIVELGFASLTSSSSYYQVDTDGQYDNSGIVENLPYYYGGFPRLSDIDYNAYKDRAFTEEVRIVSPGDGRFNYVLGGYYQYRKSSVFQYDIIPGITSWANLPGSGDAGGRFVDDVPAFFGGTPPGTVPNRPIDTAFDFSRNVRFRDVAAFGELSYKITPAVKITGGFRQFWQKFRQDTVQHYYYAGTTFGSDSLGTSTGQGARSFSDHIFKANASWDFAPDQLAYFTFSQGFRAGGANAFPVGTCGLCDSADLIPYKSDRANNYELGVKGKIGSFHYSTAVYKIDWTDIQLSVSSAAGTPIIVNGEGARSQGFELEAGVRIGQLNLNGGYAYTDSVLTDSFTRPGGFDGVKGTSLPGVSKHQLSLGADLPVPIGNGHAINVHLDGNYRSSFNNQIVTNTAAYRRLSGYGMVNGFLSYDATDKITFKVFARNILNEKGVSAYSRYYNRFADPAGEALAQTYDPVEFVSTPRTVGVTVSIRH